MSKLRVVILFLSLVMAVFALEDNDLDLIEENSLTFDEIMTIDEGLGEIEPSLFNEDEVKLDEIEVELNKKIEEATKEDSYEITEKKVLGKDKREIKSKIDIIDDIENKTVENDEVNIKISDNKLENLNELQNINPKLSKDTDYNEYFDYNVNIIIPPLVIVKDENIDKNNKNYLIFGAGGYKDVDSFKYIIDYSNFSKEEDFYYYLHLGRDISGTDRENSNISIDNYFGKIWYKKLSMGLSHIIKESELPGSENNGLKAEKKDESSELNLRYTLIDNPASKLKLGTNLYYNDTASLTEIRDFNNNFYKVFMNYNKFFTVNKLENDLTFDLIYSIDQVNLKTDEDGKSMVFSSTISEDMKLRKYDVDLNVKAGLEINKKDILNDETNILASLEVDKDLNQYINLNFIIGQDNFTKNRRSFYENFIFDNDLLPVGELNSEKIFTTGLGGEYRKDNLYLGAHGTYFKAKEKVVYQENLSSLNGENVITIQNSSDDLDWIELDLNGSYLFNRLSMMLEYKYKTLEDIAFSPNNELDLQLGYIYNSYKSKINTKFYSEMYGQNEKLNKLDSYYTIDWLNTYKINKSVSLSFNVFNVLGNDGEKKTDYSIDSRKAVLEIKIDY